MFKIIGETHIDFMAARKAAFVLTLILIVAGIASLILHGGPRYSIDFAGGRLVELAFSQPVEAEDVRSALSDVGISDVEVQHFEAGAGSGSGDLGVILRFKEDVLASAGGEDGSPTGRIIRALKAQESGLEIDVRREESVGPKIGSELRSRAIKAIIIALAAILIYVGIRYEFVFALGAVAALFHDVFITLGIFSILNIEISLPIVAAFLTIAGYSINDTIVVFDRIRERRRSHMRSSLREIMNISINQVLSRTIVTSVTTIFVVLALFLFGGPVIHDFATAMLIGVAIGTYSSIFVATSLAYTILNTRQMAKKRKVAAAV